MKSIFTKIIIEYSSQTGIPGQQGVAGAASYPTYTYPGEAEYPGRALRGGESFSRGMCLRVRVLERVRQNFVTGEREREAMGEGREIGMGIREKREKDTRNWRRAEKRRV